MNFRVSLQGFRMSESRANQLVEHFFRNQFGQLVSRFVRQFGAQHFDLIEDSVQAALADALRSWKIKGAPDNPTGWVYRVARNKMIDAIRRQKTLQQKAEELAEYISSPGSDPKSDFEWNQHEFRDDVLRMMFACCHPALPVDSKIPLTLKIICGFSETEIARGLLLTEETARKRIYRAKQSLIQNQVSLDLPEGQQLLERLNAVHNVLYLMFNEGYCSSGTDHAIRQDVCEEAARLCHLLTESQNCQSDESFALLALMLFHACRFQSRIGQEGELILLEDQDRKAWDRRMMNRAFEFFARSAECETPSSYHLEAAIAMNHCRAKRFEDTNWDAIVQLYDQLVRIRPSPVYRLNRAIAIGQRDGPENAIAELMDVGREPMLIHSHLLPAAMGEMYRLKGDVNLAKEHFEEAVRKAITPHEKAILLRRIKQCQID